MLLDGMILSQASEQVHDLLMQAITPEVTA
jgi:hypothetical protein